MGKIQKIREQKKIEATLHEEERKKKRKKYMIIAGIIVLVLVIVVVVIFYFIHLNKAKKVVKATIETDKGNIELELYKNAAPNTVENFVKLAKENFYDGTKFHRVVADFVIQGGDPLSKDDNPNNDGTGGPGYAFNDEINPIELNLSDSAIMQLRNQGYVFDYSVKSISHTIGTISMANSGPNTNGSQFFITLEDLPELDGKHTAFGRVIGGIDIVQKIEQDDIINKITINN